MEPIQDTTFVVYQRLDKAHAGSPAAGERRLTACSTYAEARAVTQQCRQEAKDCVIRFEGIAGGGD